MNVKIALMGDAREVSLLEPDSEGYFGLEFKTQQLGDDESTFVRIGLHPHHAGHLLDLLLAAQRKHRFPSPSGSIVQEKLQ